MKLPLALVVKMASRLLGVVLICIATIGVVLNLLHAESLGVLGLVMTLALGFVYGYVGIELIKLRPIARYWGAALCVISATVAYLIGGVFYRSIPGFHEFVWVLPTTMLLFALLVWWPESWVRIYKGSNHAP